MNRGPEKIGRFLGAMIVIALCLLLSSCSTYRLSTINHDPIYGPEDVVLTVPSDVKIDTIDSYFQLRSKLRRDFNFRWDFAQYAMQQPYNWYWSNPRLESLWRPYNRFDVYFYSNWFWSDWAFNYPYHSYWGMNSWYRPWGWNSWNRPYDPWNNWYQGPWHNPGYNAIWNSSRENVNIAYVRGHRGSRIGSNSIIQRDNNNIENTIVRRYNKPRNNNNNIDNIVNELRENYNIKPRVYNNPDNVNLNNNNNIIRVKPNNNNNSINNNNIRGSWRPNNNSNSSNNIYTRPPVNNSSTISRGSSSSVNSAGSSRGGNSNRRN